MNIDLDIRSSRHETGRGVASSEILTHVLETSFQYERCTQQCEIETNITYQSSSGPCPQFQIIRLILKKKLHCVSLPRCGARRVTWDVKVLDRQAPLIHTIGPILHELALSRIHRPMTVRVRYCRKKNCSNLEATSIQDREPTRNLDSKIHVAAFVSFQILIPHFFCGDFFDSISHKVDVDVVLLSSVSPSVVTGCFA
jgi:hypothetical protein